MALVFFPTLSILCEIKMRIVNFLQAVVILHRTIHFFFQGIKLLRGK